MSVAGVVDAESGAPTKYSSECAILVDRYEVV